MFQLDKHDAVLANLNLRKENHGDEKKAAADLKFTLAAPNTLLDSIDKALRPAFFRKPGKGEQQALPIDGNNLVALNLPLLGEQKIATEYEAYEVEIASLLGHIEPLFFADAKVKKIAWLPIEGGSISMSLTVSVQIDEATTRRCWPRGAVAKRSCRWCRRSNRPWATRWTSRTPKLPRPRRSAWSRRASRPLNRTPKGGELATRQ